MKQKTIMLHSLILNLFLKNKKNVYVYMKVERKKLYRDLVLHPKYSLTSSVIRIDATVDAYSSLTLPWIEETNKSKELGDGYSSIILSYYSEET